jgi:hypothetical protein
MSRASALALRRPPAASTVHARAHPRAEPLALALTLRCGRCICMWFESPAPAPRCAAQGQELAMRSLLRWEGFMALRARFGDGTWGASGLESRETNYRTMPEYTAGRR